MRQVASKQHTPLFVSTTYAQFSKNCTPRHALHVLVANLGSPKEALEAGAEKEWLPLALQYDKDSSEKL